MNPRPTGELGRSGSGTAILPHGDRTHGKGFRRAPRRAPAARIWRGGRHSSARVFLTVVSAGLPCGEILGLRWKDVAHGDPAGATLRVREMFVRGQAAAGMGPGALQARAGHTSISTTRLYIDLAGQSFREEAELLERRLLGVEGSGRNLPIEATTPDVSNGDEDADWRELCGERSGVGVEPTQRRVAPPHRF
jgi:hypothetical protein